VQQLQQRLRWLVARLKPFLARDGTSGTFSEGLQPRATLISHSVLQLAGAATAPESRAVPEQSLEQSADEVTRVQASMRWLVHAGIG
jgi:hypothetical protein